MPSNFPKISVVIPTLNAEKVLTNCLISIRSQIYDQAKIEILICDGGSTDNTRKIAHKYNCKILPNPLMTGEAGKAVGIKKASGKYIALIDSDNILPDKNWLSQSIKPLEDNPEIIGSEPWEYTYRREGGFIERYSALTGVNDPFVLIAGNYDRKSVLSNNWTKLVLDTKDYAGYQLIKFNKNDPLPTIGANGTIFQKAMLDQLIDSNYLIDVDILYKALQKYKYINFAKVKTGIIHTFCESSITKFYQKQNRRVTDLYHYQHLRDTPSIKSRLIPIIKYTLYVIFIFPMLFDTVRGFFKKPDIAWLFHPLANIITLYCYGVGTIKYKLGLLKPINRYKWKQ